MPTSQPRILPRCRGSLERPRAVAFVRIGPSFAIDPSRCNRCGACLRLDCGAIFDAGGESLVVDPVACSGCAACGPVCRSRALAPIDGVGIDAP